MKYLTLLIFFIAINVHAKQELQIPRFVSIKSSEANIRTGPNVRYPIKWVFVKKNEPVEIVAEFEHWRKIRDKSGDEGWVHESMLSGKRNAIIIGDKKQIAFNKPSINASGVFFIEPEVRVELLLCNNKWCKISVENMKAWIDRSILWGIYKDEEIK